MPHSSYRITFVRNDKGKQEAADYLEALILGGVADGSESVELFSRLCEMETDGPVGESISIIDGRIEMYALRYQHHVVVHAFHPEHQQIFVLTAFAENDWSEGIHQAEELVRSLFDLP